MCEACMAGCDTCFEAGLCEMCTVAGKKCPDSFFEEAQTLKCLTCNVAECKTCLAADACDACFDGYDLSGDKTTCTANTTVAPCEEG